MVVVGNMREGEERSDDLMGAGEASAENVLLE